MKGVVKKFVNQSMVATSTMLAALCFSNPLLAFDKSSSDLKLYTFDCGTIDVSNMDVFSSSGDYADQSQRLVGSCYLIRHQQGDLLWDTGLSAELVDRDPLVNGVFTLSMKSTLRKLNISHTQIRIDDGVVQDILLKLEKLNCIECLGYEAQSEVFDPLRAASIEVKMS